MATINYVGEEAAKALYKRCKKAVNLIKIWADSRFILSINGKSGNSVTINKDDIGLDKVDNTPDSEKYVAHAVSADSTDMLDGKHAEDFLLKSEHEDFANEISLSISDLEKRKVNISDLVDYTVTITETDASGNSLKSYVISQKGNTIGTINIPKDLVVSSGSLVVGDWVDGVFTENLSGTGKAIKLIIANQTDPIYINVQDLVDVYTAAKGATEIQLAISNTNEISATLVKSVRNKIDNAIPKVSDAVGKVAQFKADGSLESSSFEIHKSVPSNAVFTDTIIDNIAGDGITVSGDHGENIFLDTNTKNAITNAKIDHINLGGHTVGRDIPSDAVFTDTIIDNEAGEGIEVSGSHNKIISLSGRTQDILVDAATDHIKLNGIEAGALKNIVTSVAGKIGDVVLVKDDIGLGNVDNTADADKHVAHASTADNADTLEGKHVADFMLKSEHDEYDAVIATSLTDLDARKQDKLPFTSTPSNENKVVTQNELNIVITGASSYLGTIESVTSLSTTAKKGDFYRVKTAWDGVSIGDLIIAEKNNPAAIIDGINWSLIHNQTDADTTYTFEDGTDSFSVTPSTGNKQKVNVAVTKVSGHFVKSNVPANAEFTDYKATKEGHYIPVEESASLLSASASGGILNWEIDVVKGVTIKRDSKGHVIGIAVLSGKLPANPNTDYLATYEGHYIPTNNNNVLNPDISILRDTSRDIAFIGSIKGDNKSHITEVTTCAVLAFTDAEIQTMVDLAIANITSEME